MIRSTFRAAAFLVGATLVFSTQADDQYGPGDPIAAIDGEPVYLGELNLILSATLRADNLDKVDMKVQQATALLLVRRHLAMKSLQQLGGEALDAMIQRRLDTFAAEVRRRGSSLAEHAEARMSDKASLRADFAWQVAWSRYTGSRLNETNLRKYFQRHIDRYGGNRWEVSQIFVELDSPDRPTIESTRDQLTALANEIRASGAVAEEFANAARQHSDSGSAAQGGLVGWVENDGDLPSSVMAVIRNLEPGQISRPARSPLGMHLLYVHRKEAGKLTYEGLTDQAQLRRDAANALFDALVARQRDAKVAWFIKALRPPKNVPVIP